MDRSLTRTNAPLVIALLLFGSVTFGAGIVRLDSIAVHLGQGTTPEELINARYVANPVMSQLHILTGTLLFILAPFQFSQRLRNTWPKLHRISGRLIIAAATVTGLAAIWAAIVFPAFGGPLTAVVTYVAATYMLIALTLAYLAIKRRDIARHRRWMIRMFATALGVTTIRICFGLAGVLFGISLESSFGWSFLAGFSINIAVAELIIWRRKI